ncbi:dihydrofolate reductase [Demequina aestuarii]|uniref:dihydrofolate reductase n=1 Tax=Demequina aestuarii TaxID=327095 RepID=UPI0007814415|nr:dihydrofolate reductase [Demequina aestuarii]
MLKAIWAQARDAAGTPVIGSQGDMPWHLPEDLRRFKELTSGAAVLMGRRTWESFPEQFRPLPGRVNIVITSGGTVQGADATVGSLAAAIEVAARRGDGADAWVIGGGRVYGEALPMVDQLEVTEIDLEVDGDTFAPAIDAAVWEIAAEDPWLTSRTGLRYRFLTYVRR